MKKVLIAAVVIVVVAGALLTAGAVYAQAQVFRNPWGMMGGFGQTMMSGFGDEEGPWNHMQGTGMMGGNWGGMMGGQYGPMHDIMVSAVAEELGMTPDALNEALADGETMWQIAEDQGLSSDEITALMQDAHNTTIAQAIEDGTITEDQAEWMNSHMQQMLSGDGSFGGHCFGGSQE